MNEKKYGTAEGYVEKRRFHRRWHRVALVLASIVVFCTTYALILPAITKEKTCPLEEHQHDAACYEMQEVTTLTCTEAHEHTDACYSVSQTQVLICDREAHVHSEDCSPTALTAEEVAQVDAVMSQIDALPAYSEVYDTLNAYEAAENVDGMAQYYAQVVEQVSAAAAAYDALSEAQKATVTNVEKLQTLLGLTESDVETVYGKTVLYQIWNGYDWEEVGRSGFRTGTVAGETRAYVDVATMESFFAAYGYSRDNPTENLTCSYNDIYTIFYVADGKVTNYCIDVTGGSFESGTLIQLYTSNDSAAQKFRIIESGEYQGYHLISGVDEDLFINFKGGKAVSGMQLILWDNATDKANHWRLETTADGKITFHSALDDSFLIDLYEGTQTDGQKIQGNKNGTCVQWKLVQQYTEDSVISDGEGDNCRIGLTKENNGSIVVRYKPASVSSAKLETVQGADTRDLIEVNLYDYGTNINEKYNGDKKYPGFQQDNGTGTSSTSLSLYAFNFGNNITSDLKAGKSSVTNQGGTINTTENGANTPISGAIASKLIGGYPALSDNTSLAYLFSNNTYAKKMNTQSINGLFQYNEATGAYTYNSRHNHAQFNSGDDTFTLYKQIITSNFMMYPFGNFLPFNDIKSQCTQASTIGKTELNKMAAKAKEKSGSEYATLNTVLTDFVSAMDSNHSSGWSAEDCVNEYFEKAKISRKFSNADLSNLYSINFDEATDFYFGMEMKMKFMQPKDGLTGNDGQQPMIFYFTGDDDVWVYIDDVLFLDLSGIHRHVGGEIDFVNGEVRYFSLDITTGDVSGVPYKVVTFEEILGSKDGLNETGTFKDYTTHSFNFYYMERGAGSGVCRMNFNFPLLRKNSISVSKELSVDEGSTGLLQGNPDFCFQVLREDGKTLFIAPGTTYTVRNAAGNEIGNGTVDENGIFRLKAGQTAVFDNIPENAGKYYVRELLTTDTFGQYGTFFVDGTTTTENYDVTVGTDSFKGVNSPLKDVSDGSTIFHFNNQVTFKKLGSLTITKEMGDQVTDAREKEFTFRVMLDGVPLQVGTAYTIGSETYQVTDEGIIHLKPGQTAVISNILAGTRFTVVEEKADGYVATYTPPNGDSTRAEGLVAVETPTAVTVTNYSTGTQVCIPVCKAFTGGVLRKGTFTFRLTGGDETDVTQTIAVSTENSPQSGNFILTYLEKDVQLDDTGQKIFTYELREVDDGQPSVIYDEKVYEVTVTIWKENDRLYGSYAIDGIEKTAKFENQLIAYELPETGGPGTEPYTLAGMAAVTLATSLLLYSKRKRRREEENSS